MLGGPPAWGSMAIITISGYFCRPSDVKNSAGQKRFFPLGPQSLRLASGDPQALQSHTVRGLFKVHDASLKIWIRSLGCKVNLSDAAQVIQWLAEDRVELVEGPDLADVVLLNTCTVTHKADRDVRKILGRLASDYPELEVVVTGCAVHTCAERIRSYPNVRAILPIGDPKAVAAALGPASSVRQSGKNSPFTRLGRKRAFAKVQDGCDARCTYCVISRVRGPQRSLACDEAVELVRNLLECGHAEVVLTGIHLGRYGQDLQTPMSLVDLLDGLAAHFSARPGTRLRLSSIEPLEWSPQLLDALERHPFVCPHVHLPIQSGSDSVLQRMGRPYLSAQVTETLQNLRRRFPAAALGADVLVGFPGEDHQDFDDTLVALQGWQLDYLHVFTFSPRPQTPAASMPDQVPSALVRERAAEIRELGRKSWLRFVATGLNSCHQVLIERNDGSNCSGRSEHYRRMRLSAPAPAGSILLARALRVEGDQLLADAVPARGEAACVPA